MRLILTNPSRTAIAVLSAALISTTALTLAPSPAFAVPAGGYADLVEEVSPAVVFIEVTAKAANTFKRNVGHVMRQGARWQSVRRSQQTVVRIPRERNVQEW